MILDTTQHADIPHGIKMASRIISVYKRMEEPNRPIETSGIKMEGQREHNPLIIYSLSMFDSPAG